MELQPTPNPASEWLLLIGKHLKNKRVRMQMKQGELAARAGISVVTVSRLENGKGSSLEAFVNVARVLHEEGWLEQFVREPAISPAAAWHQKPPRQRVR